MFALDSVPRPTCPTASNCWPAPQGFLPFQSVYYVTPPNAVGDRLVVGKPFSARQLVQWINSVPPADTNTAKFCGFVQLAPALAVETYLPTPAERFGDFSSFGVPLIDPGSGQPFPGNLIPITRFDDIFAWRIPATTATQAMPPSYSAGSTGPVTSSPLFALGQDVALSLLAASAGGFACSTTVICRAGLTASLLHRASMRWCL